MFRAGASHMRIFHLLRSNQPQTVSHTHHSPGCLLCARLPLDPTHWSFHSGIPLRLHSHFLFLTCENVQSVHTNISGTWKQRPCLSGPVTSVHFNQVNPALHVCLFFILILFWFYSISIRGRRRRRGKKKL